MSDEETNSPTSCMAWERVHFQQINMFSLTVPLTCYFHIKYRKIPEKDCLHIIYIE